MKPIVPAEHVKPGDPRQAQQIVATYAEALERDMETGRLPAPADSLPFATPVIKSAIETSARAAASSGQMTHEIREFLETAYVSLADYVASDLARLLAEYRRAADEFAAGDSTAQPKLTGAAWRTLTETSRLAGDIARSIAAEAQQLRSEFQRLG